MDKNDNNIQVEKPITMAIEDFKKDLINVVNNSKLHPYIVDSVVKELYNEIHVSYLNQVQLDKENYEKNIQK